MGDEEEDDRKWRDDGERKMEVEAIGIVRGADEPQGDKEPPK